MLGIPFCDIIRTRKNPLIVMVSKYVLIALVICSVFCNGSLLGRKISPLGQEIVGPRPDYTGPCQGTFPDPDDCRLFIECWAGDANTWRCTDQMLFDLNYNGCNYAQQVHCDDRPRPTDVPSTVNTPGSTVPTTTSNVTTSTTPAPLTTPPPPIDYTCPEGNGVFAHETRCEYYWNCYDGDVALVHCLTNLLFDRRYNGCNYPEYTDCDHRERPEGSGPNPSTVATTAAPITTPPPPTTPYTGPTTPVVEPTLGPSTPSPPPSSTTRRPGEFQCPGGQEADGNYPDPTDCTRFYTCSNGNASLNKCPLPLYYNIPTDTCDYKNNVDCGTRP